MQNQNNQNEPTKAEVQTTKLNKMPVPNNNDTEFSAEVAAEAFDQNQNASRTNANSQQ